MVSPVGDKFFVEATAGRLFLVCKLALSPIFGFKFYCRKIASLGVGYPTLFGAVIPHSSFLISHSAPLGAAMSFLTPHSSLNFVPHLNSR